MSKIVQISDFVGKYAIASNSFTSDALQPYIDKFELSYLRDLLGVDLTDLLLADITTPFAEPDTTIYKTIYNELAIDDSGLFCKQLRSIGIKNMLLGFIYFEYVRQQPVKNTITGNVIAQNEASTQAKWGETDIYNIYNESVNAYKAIQYYLEQNLTDYPTYNGLVKHYTSQFI